MAASGTKSLVTFCLIIAFSRPVQTDDYISTCVGSTVKAGATATITCHFYKEVKDSQFLVRRKNTNSTEKPDDVVDCYFMGHTRHCDVWPGFNFSCKAGKNQTLFITNVTKEDEGTYFCQLLTNDPQECKDCELNVNYESHIKDDSQTVITTNEGTPKKDDRLGDAARLGIIAGSGILLLLVVAAIFLFKKHRRSKTDANLNATRNKAGVFRPLTCQA